MENWEGANLREFERLGSDLIPASLKNLYVDQGTGDRLKGETTDFTVKGVRLLLPCPSSDYSKGDGLIISPEDGSFKLIGEIIHIIGIGETNSYAGIRFLRTKPLQQYHRILEENELIDSEATSRIGE